MVGLMLHVLGLCPDNHPSIIMFINYYDFPKIIFWIKNLAFRIFFRIFIS
jgi:hypothetical protein